MTLEQWQRRSEWPLAIAAVVFLAGYSWEVLQPDMSSGLRRGLQVVDYLTWGMFVIDYLVQLVLARQRRSWFVRHLPDLLIVVLPLLRPLRLLRMIALLRFIDRKAITTLQGRVAAYVALATVLVLYAAALAELEAERGATGSNITTFGTALWWAITTITTVGYGDHYPVTTEGRCVAAALMIAGVAFLGSVTASLASWLVGRVAPSPPEPTAQLADLQAQVAHLTTLVEASRREQSP